MSYFERGYRDVLVKLGADVIFDDPRTDLIFEVEKPNLPGSPTPQYGLGGAALGALGGGVLGAGLGGLPGGLLGGTAGLVGGALAGGTLESRRQKTNPYHQKLDEWVKAVEKEIAGIPEDELLRMVEKGKPLQLGRDV